MDINSLLCKARGFKSFCVSKYDRDGWKISANFSSLPEDRVTISYRPTKSGRHNFKIYAFGGSGIKASAKRNADNDLVVTANISPLLISDARDKGINLPNKLHFVVNDSNIMVSVNNRSAKAFSNESTEPAESYLTFSGEILGKDWKFELHSGSQSISTSSGQASLDKSITHEYSLVMSIDDKTIKVTAHETRTLAIEGSLYELYSQSDDEGNSQLVNYGVDLLKDFSAQLGVQQ